MTLELLLLLFSVSLLLTFVVRFTRQRSFISIGIAVILFCVATYMVFTIWHGAAPPGSSLPVYWVPGEK